MGGLSRSLLNVALRWLSLRHEGCLPLLMGEPLSAC